MLRLVMILGLAMRALSAQAEGLSAERLGVIYSVNDPASRAIAQYYAARRHVPAVNVVGLPVPERAILNRDELSVPCASGCWTCCRPALSRFCSSGRGLMPWSACRSRRRSPPDINPPFVSGWVRPHDRKPAVRFVRLAAGLTAHRLAARDAAAEHRPGACQICAIDRAIQSDGSAPSGTVYLVRTRMWRATSVPPATRISKRRIRPESGSANSHPPSHRRRSMRSPISPEPPKSRNCRNLGFAPEWSPTI